MNKKDRILVLGANGMVGRSLVTKLKSLKYTDIHTPPSSQLDLRDQVATRSHFNYFKPEYVFFLSAKVGGIMANIQEPATFAIDNLNMQNNVISSAHDIGVKKLLFIGSTCIYPANCPQPIKEEYLMTGPVEETNFAYAVAKIAGLKLCQAYRRQYKDNFISVMPCNLYGPHDNFDPVRSHVMSAMIRRFVEAKKNDVAAVTCFGDGSAMREFLYVDDAADGMLHLMLNYNEEQHINLGTGLDCTIKELAETVARVVGYTGDILWDTSKPNGMLRKVTDATRLHAAGWHHKVSLEDGIRKTYNWYTENVK